MWHGCGDYSVEAFPAGTGGRGRALFDGFVDLVRRCGPIEVVPTRSRVALMVRVRFAGVSRVSDRGMTIAFALRQPTPHPRIRKIERYAPG
jgi:hypothetical protein